MKRSITICLLLLGLVSAVQAASGDAAGEPDRVYLLGVFPYFSKPEMQAIYLPVAKELSTRTGMNIEFTTESTHKQFLHKLNNEYYDFALIPPFWFPVAVDEKNYLPLLKMVEPFTSQVLVLEGSPLRNINDLRGKTIATPPAFTPVVYLTIKALTGQNIIPGRDVTLKAQKTVDACFQQVLTGQADACVSPPFAPAHFEESRNVRFRPLLKSQEITGIALVAHARVNEATRQRLYDHVFAWPDNPQGRKLLDAMKIQRFVPITEDDYKKVRVLLKRTRPMH